MYNTVIFDIDGTLADSSKGIKEAVKYTINKQQLKSLSDSELNDFIGYSPLPEAFMHYCGVDKNTASVCSDIYRKYYAENSVVLTKLYNGMIELLDCLVKNNYKLGVATYKQQKNAVLLLNALNIGNRFSSICGADDENLLTKEDILKNCIKELNSPACNCIFIGDSPVDGLAAKNLGCGFIAVTYGFGFKNKTDIKDCSPVFIADNTKEIKEFLCLQNV